jgi:Tol biopolymer transport system component
VIYNGEEPQYTIYARPADGSRETRLLLKEPQDTIPCSVSPDGKCLVYSASHVETNADLWLLPLDGEGEPRPLLQTPFVEVEGIVSPGGNWLAYNSNETGRSEIYVMPFPEGGARVQVSIAGGHAPVWSPDGEELFFLADSGMMAARIDRQLTTDDNLVIGRPERLFGGLAPSREGYGSTPNVGPEGRRFLLAVTPDESRPRTLRVVVNWFSELRGIE